MIPKTLDLIASSDIAALVTDQFHESRNLEFKRDPVGSRDEDKREFLADVSALANTLGGDIVFGVEEVGGFASGLAPLRLPDPDVEILRLENILRSGLEPRLPKYDIHWISHASDEGFIVVRVPRSWISPHRVIFRDHSKFYGRNSTGKYPMDVSELRLAFNSTETMNARIHAFRRDRMATIEAGESPVMLNEGARLLFHIIPQSAFLNPETVMPSEQVRFAPLHSSGWNFLHTLEGFATYTGSEDADSSRAYTLVFRSGIVEAAAHIGYEGEQGKFVYPSGIEAAILHSSPMYFRNLGHLGITPPYFVSLTLFGVRDYALHMGSRWFHDSARSIRRDVLVFPEIFTEEAQPDMSKLYRPIFDMVWQAFGRERSFSFNDRGEYVGDR